MNADRIVSISAIILSLGTLFVIIYQTNLMRKSEMASVMPYLQIGFQSNQDRQRLVVSNGGLGPAFIDQVEILHQKGEVIYKGSPSIFAFSQEEDSAYAFNKPTVELLMPGRLIPAETEIYPFKHGREGENGNFIRENFMFPYNKGGGRRIYSESNLFIRF